MLVGAQIAHIHLFIHRQRRHALVGIIIRPLVLIAFFDAIHLEETGERDLCSRNTKRVIANR